MIVYYIAYNEKPEDTQEVRFFIDHGSAHAAAIEERKQVFQFECNNKCDTNNFGLDTIMVFTKDLDTGELKFVISGQWLEIHEIMNVPFYYDFESRSKRFVSMSLQYFNKNYVVKEKMFDQVDLPVRQEKINFVEEDRNIEKKPVDLQTVSVNQDVVQKKISKRGRQKKVKQENELEQDVIEDDVLGELFGVIPETDDIF